MYIASIGAALPDNFYDQETLIGQLRENWATRHRNVKRIESIHKNALVGGRHLALTVEEYLDLDTFTKSNDAFIRVGAELGARAIRQGLEIAGIDPQRLGHIFFVSITGIAAPSLDAMIVNRLGLRSDIKRTPIFGLGCVAGAAGTTKVYDYLKAYPDEAAVLLSVELCSLTLQRSDLSITNIIASGLFGDGASALIMTGANCEPSGPKVLGTRSIFYPDSERVMGWDVTGEGFKIVLSAETPKLVEKHVGPGVDQFLADHGLSRDDIKRWAFHPGGPKVIESFRNGLGLTDEDLRVSWESLKQYGNLSSSSVLFILKEIMENDPPPAGSYGIMIAMGPGFCAEMVLLQW
jgi:alkylresorcinol/alkylpyrone synthase